MTGIQTIAGEDTHTHTHTYACRQMADAPLPHPKAGQTLQQLHAVFPMHANEADKHLRKFGVFQHALNRSHVILSFCSLPDGPLHHPTHVQDMSQCQPH